MRICWFSSFFYHCTIEYVHETVRWNAKKFGVDIHGPQRTKPTDFHDPLTFPQAASWTVLAFSEVSHS